MSRSRNQNPIDAFEDLLWQVQKGKPHPSDPMALKMREIKTLPQVFQHRRPAEYSSNAHIKALAEAAKSQGSLASMTVWWSGKNWVCVDGHHRLAAYALAEMREVDVPVEVFRGTPAEAMARAAYTNSMDKLPMTRGEKVNAGWRLVVMDQTLSKAKQALAVGISERQIAAMRLVRKKLILKGNNPSDLAEMRWETARKTAAGEDIPEWTDEEQELRVQKMALALRKALGATAEAQPEVFARAVEAYSSKLSKGLEDWFGGDREDDDEKDLEET